MTNRYYQAWESFWSTLTGKPEEVLWAVQPNEAAALDWQNFQPHVDVKLPLVDVGCGDGIQTRFFGQYFEQVMGVDVSPAIVNLAQSNYSLPNVQYRVLDALDPAAGAALHAEIGDANIYIRGVLMQFLPPDRLTVVDTLKQILGQHGVLYLCEYPPQAKTFYEGLFKAQGMYPGFARVLQHGITPGGISEADITTIFPPSEFETLATGEAVMSTIIPLDEGGFAQAPAFYKILKLHAN